MNHQTHTYTQKSYDHVELLGDTLGAIAWQKAGIIKEGRPALTPETQVGGSVDRWLFVWMEVGSTNHTRPLRNHQSNRRPTMARPNQQTPNPKQDPAVLRVLRAEAHSRHAPLHEIAVVEDNTNFQGPLGAQGGRCYHPVNLALAKAALRCLLLLSPSPDSPPLAAAASGDTGEAAARDAAVLTKGWVRAFWPGRFEVFSDQRALGPGLAVVLDMAHNVDSVARLLAEAKGRFGSGEAGTELWVLFGTGNDKDAVGMLARLLQGGASESGASVRRLALCQAANARAVPVEALAALAARARQSGSAAAGAVVVEGAGGAVAPGPALERLLREALTESAGTPVALLVCGSLYVVAAARAHLAATRPGLFASREDWAFHPDPPLGGGK